MKLYSFKKNLISIKYKVIFAKKKKINCNRIFKQKKNPFNEEPKTL